MTRFHSTVVRMLALAVLLFACSMSQAEDKKAGKKKKGDRPTVGTVSEVTKDKDKDEGTIKVSVAGKKKQNTPATDKTFKVTSSTKIEKQAAGKKKDKTAKSAGETVKFSALAKDQRVRITTKGDTVEQITIMAAKGKKKKAA